MKKLLVIILVFFFATNTSSAQFSRYIILLKDKKNSPFTTANPSQFLTQRSIDRRKRYNIAIDETDLPVNTAYTDSIRLAGNVIILNTSKWLNQVCIQTTDTVALNKIKTLSFVKIASPIAARVMNNPVVNKQSDPLPGAETGNANKPQGTADYYNYGQSFQQVHLHNTEFLHNHGFKGMGMQLAIMDAGFYHYQTLPTFDSVRNNNRILGTWDFVANEASVNEDYAHGMECFSTIAANMPGTFVGTAPETSFYLYRTEDANTEYPVEEQNWAAAAERADSLGVDVFSVSLGYTTFDNPVFNYTYASMDGNTTIIARAADFAAKKGIIVTIANGNEGNSAWHYLTTPADADSVLSVGAVFVSRQPASFSSYGPSSDGRIKPDVAAVGAGAVVANPGTGAPFYNNGTSFSCPIMAGISTCLWQAFPEINNMQLIDALHQSADKFLNPDTRTGYGIPDAKKAFVLLIKKLFTKQVIVDNGCMAQISLTLKSAADMVITVERKLPADTGFKAVSVQHSNAGFAANNFLYADDLSALPSGTSVNYRFKMDIAADTSFYLDSSTITLTASCIHPVSNGGITIGPNPVSERVSVVIKRNSSLNAAIEMYSSNGQKVYGLANQMVTGSREFFIPVKKFNPGIYFISVYIDNKKAITKKIILY